MTSPYRFLDPYEVTDQQWFFGREAEVNVLVADIVISRLVVLFAKTGTGKTSLINAGVRPVLHDRGYATYLIRVDQDPVRSALAVLNVAHPGLVTKNRSFAERLRQLASTLRRPIVLFFDQFEEFFLFYAKEQPERAARFVSDIAEIYANVSSGVHVVFSMREEFFVELELFRDAIPTIFHSESNLRLRWFDRVRAAAAIAEPASAAGVTIEPELVARLVADLEATGLAASSGPRDATIEPAQLQIVCDALWRAQKGAHIALDSYLELGRRGAGTSVAEQLLERRMEEEFGRIPHREELDLLERLLPELCTDSGTKWVREIDGLASALSTERAVLVDLIERLDRARLVEIVTREDATFVALVHDYLADTERVASLQRAVRRIWPRRLLRRAREGGAPLTAHEVADVLERVDDIELSAEDGDFVLRTALSQGIDVAVTLPALEARGVAVWDVLGERLQDAPANEAVAIVDELARLGTPPALAMLARALDRPDVAADAISGLGRLRTAEAVDLLAARLSDDALGDKAAAALAKLASGFGRPEMAERATAALEEHSATAEDAIAVLGAVESVSAVRRLERFLREVERAGLAREALRGLMASTLPEVAAAARSVLLTDARRALVRGEVDAATVQLLAGVEDTGAVELLEQLVGDPVRGPEAEAALRALHRSSDASVAASAERALDSHAGVSTEDVRRGPKPIPSAPERRVLLDDSVDPTIGRIMRPLFDGRLVPFIGGGVNFGDRSAGGVDRERFLPTAWEMASHLARFVAYPHDSPQDLLAVAQYVDVMLGRAVLLETVHDLLSVRVPPTTVHRLLARLPEAYRAWGPGTSHPVIVTVLFDDLMERALEEAREPFDVLTYVSEGPDRGRFLHDAGDDRPTLIEDPKAVRLPEGRLALVKLHGSIDVRDPDRDSIVITEDDIIEYASRPSPLETLPVEIVSTLRRSGFLFLGYGLHDFTVRVLLARLWRSSRRQFRSWALMRDPPALTERYWAMRDVEVIDAELTAFAHELQRALDSTD